MSQNYLDIAKQGKNSWWRYLLGILLILFLWLFVGTIFTGIFIFAVIAIPLSHLSLDSLELQQQLQQKLPSFLTTPSIAAYVAVNISFVFFCLGVFLAVRCLHKRKFCTLLNANGSINFKRLLSGFGVWFLLNTILIVIAYFLQPQNFEFTFNPKQWFLLLPLALLLTPMQIATEEFFFRGYLLQGLGLITRRWLPLMVATGVLFMLPHLNNPEVARGPVWLALYYFAFGVFQSLLVLLDNRLELALGVHAATNLNVLFLNTKDSVLPAPAILMINDAGDPKWGLVVFLVQSAVFYYVFFARKSA